MMSHILASIKSAVHIGTFLISANAGPSQSPSSCSPSSSRRPGKAPGSSYVGEYMNQKGVKTAYLIAPN